ncbi:MAG TPA: hypothetical protein VMP11_07775 [Verrucomicrobiae bacterium]|nr:hypothetical protein [Verrucomicrobiae bacterium]
MKLQALAFIVGLAVALTGCKTPEGAYVAVANPGSPEAAGVPVVLLNYDLTRTLAVDRPPLVDRDSAGRLRIQVGLRNRVDQEKLQIQVQTVWMNDAGRVLYSDIGSEAAWQTLSISPNQTLYYNQTALTDEATRFTVRVRYTSLAR